MLDDLFGKVLVINLDGQDDRMAQTVAQLKKTGTERYERLAAVDGSKLTDADRKALCTRYCQAACTPSMIGCFLSHQKAWQKCVDESLPSVLVLEDDVLFTEQAAEGARVGMGELPLEWDMYLLGCFTCDASETTLEDASISRMMYPSRRPEKKSDHLWTPTMIFGMHAYAVSQSGARKLLRLMPQASNHVDWEISKHLDKLGAYALRPGVAYQTGMDRSTMASKAPIFTNTVLSNVRLGTHKDDGRTLAWLCSEAWGRLFHDKVVVNKYFVILLLASLLGWGRAGAGLVAADLVLAVCFLSFTKNLSVASGYASLLIAVGLGSGIRALCAIYFRR